MAKKRRITRKSAKSKGRKGVTDVIKLIRAQYPHWQEDEVFRPAGSQPGEDIHFSPDARKELNISIEVKKQESLQIWKALKQCEDNAKEGVPVLFFSRAHSKMYVALPAEEFLYICRYGADK